MDLRGRAGQLKPSQHPDFFRFPAPEGRSRESTIVLDSEGRFWHDGELVEKASMSCAFSQWIRKHPDNNRFILENGYDWTYFRVEDVPFFVRAVAFQSSNQDASTQVRLTLSDESEEFLEPETICEDARGALYCRVKKRQFEARFTPSAQNALAPIVVENEQGQVGLHLAGRDWQPRPRVPSNQDLH